MYTFKGGTHIKEYKLTKDYEIERIEAPDRVAISMSQHIGAPCTPVVAAGDEVLVGQVIGTVPDGALGCPVHSSVSGKVVGTEIISGSTGNRETCVVIENDKEDRPSPEIKPPEGRITEMTKDEIVSVIRAAGITGMGGASFPSYAKINSAAGHVDRVIVNCAECEPFITADHRLLLEHPERVVGGLKTIMISLGVKEAFIAVEDNKKDAARRLAAVVGQSDMISVCLMKTKYPQGDERQLIYALTGTELPMGMLPMDAGCVIFNAGTCAAIYEAFSTGMPLVKRIVTVTGDCVKKPGNYIIPIGMKVSDVVNKCGGLVREPIKAVFGGPMMGRAEFSLDTPVKKGTSAILLLSELFDTKPTPDPECIRCGKCVANCPMRLMPAYIAQYSRLGDMASAEKFGAMSCVECGTCSYNCPAGIEIVQYIRSAKNNIKAEQRRIAALRQKES
ncbi:MAG: electron transport complex subunit RsxC [Clostridia bacterium]|nr:electron transport complex subunit RsxC [Clostridia bacterium]